MYVYIILICTYYLQFSGVLFYLFLFFIFHIDIVYECIVLHRIVKNKLTYLLTSETTQEERRGAASRRHSVVRLPRQLQDKGMSVPEGGTALRGGVPLHRF